MHQLRPLIRRTRSAVLRRLLTDPALNGRVVATLDREQAARVAALEERTRIACELHDVVAHNLSAMVVQAGGARRIAEAENSRTCEALARVEATGRETLAHMRHLLAALCDADDGPALTPQSNLSQLAARCTNATVPRPSD